MAAANTPWHLTRRSTGAGTLGGTEWNCVRMNRAKYWNPLVPELTVSDVETSLSFYAAVGFTVRFRRTDPEFVYIELGDAQLILSE